MTIIFHRDLQQYVKFQEHLRRSLRHCLASRLIHYKNLLPGLKYVPINDSRFVFVSQKISFISCGLKVYF